MTEHFDKHAKSTGRSVSAVELGKFISAFVLVLFVVWFTIFRSGSTKPFEEVSQAVQSSIEDENLVLQDSQALKKYYGLNSADYKGVLFYTSEFTMSAKEVLLIEVEHDTQVAEVKSAIEERVETRIDSFEGYAPEQVQLLEQAAYVVRGKYIFLAVTPEAETYRQAFERSL